MPSPHTTSFAGSRKTLVKSINEKGGSEEPLDISQQRPQRAFADLKSREVLPVQLVDATPLWSFDLTIRFWGPILCGRSSLLLKHKAFSLHLLSGTSLNHLNSWTWDFVLVLRRSLETTPVIGNSLFALGPGPRVRAHPDRGPARLPVAACTTCADIRQEFKRPMRIREGLELRYGRNSIRNFVKVY
jgi:hypothetical protein